MNIITLIPSASKIEAAYMNPRSGTPIFRLNFSNYRGWEKANSILREIRKEKDRTGFMLDAIAVKLPYGGSLFTEPVIADAEAVAKLAELIPSSPLHLPAIISLIGEIPSIFPGIPVVLLFETSYFTHLPERERSYAVNPELSLKYSLTRYGYHGIFHGGAFSEYLVDWRKRRNEGRPSILSICLEPRPEITAIAGKYPVMISGGSTPLEGLPGETVSGELDPAIVMMLIKEGGMGPEEVNTVLTQQSGFRGICGEDLKLDEMLASLRPDHTKARKIFLYKLLLGCGAGIAALGDIDAVVFSGRYSKSGDFLGRWMKRTLFSSGKSPELVIYDKDIHEITADFAETAVLKLRNGASSGK